MNVTDPLKSLAQSQPDAPAIETDTVGLSFADLDRAISSFATAFASAGVTAGDAVGIQVSDQVRHVVTSLALARLGVGQLIFHDSDSVTIRRELAKQVAIVAVVTDKTGGRDDEPPCVAVPRLEPVLPVPRGGESFVPSTDDDLAFLYQRTSGTTGIPKIAPMSHKAAAHRLSPHAVDFPGMRLHSLIPASFDAAKHSLYRCLLLGGCIVLGNRHKAEQVGAFIARHEVNFLTGTPVNANTLLEAAPPEGLLFPGVKVFRLGTSMVSDRLRRDICSRLTPNLYVFYGMTEIGTVSMATPHDIARVSGCVGAPIADVDVEIHDEDGNILPTGTIGRLRVRSPGMIDGYLNADEENADAFRDGWYHSGDLCAFTPEGLLIHHGRADEMMIFDGINIHPSEIETVLLRHPAIAEAAVFGYGDPARGDIPVGAVVINREVSSKELIAHCRNWLGARTVQGLIFVPALPRTPTGKVIKRELEETFRTQIEQKRSATERNEKAR